jgi:ABC-type proline/glycine betaine transport system permease subunit
MRLFAAELLKLRTIRTTWGYALALIALAELLAAGNIGSPPEGGRLAPDFQFDLILTGALPAVLLALLLGILCSPTSSDTGRSRGRCSPRRAGPCSSESSC